MRMWRADLESGRRHRTQPVAATDDETVEAEVVGRIHAPAGLPATSRMSRALSTSIGRLAGQRLATGYHAHGNRGLLRLSPRVRLL